MTMWKKKDARAELGITDKTLKATAEATGLGGKQEYDEADMTILRDARSIVEATGSYEPVRAKYLAEDPGRDAGGDNGADSVQLDPLGQAVINQLIVQSRASTDDAVTALFESDVLPSLMLESIQRRMGVLGKSYKRYLKRLDLKTEVPVIEVAAQSVAALPSGRDGDIHDQALYDEVMGTGDDDEVEEES